MSSAAPASAAPPPKPFQTKLVLLGEAAVGKSSFVLRYIHGEFEENRQPTIGAAFLTNKCRLEDKVIKFEIWDTAGQERFHSLAPMYYRNAQASVVIYDVTKAVSRLQCGKAIPPLLHIVHTRVRPYHNLFRAELL